MIHFLITFLFMLISGSIFILGFYTITRGKIIKLPNGDEEKDTEIFGGWQLFWESVDSYKKVFYYGDQLEFKLKILEQLKPAYMEEIEFSTKDRKSLIFNTKPTEAQIRDIEFTLNCKVFSNDLVMFLYDEFPVYRFSEWLRKITNCYVCLSSIGGTIYYWLFIWKFPQYIVSGKEKIIFWVIFCISLSFVNKTFKEKFANDKN